MNDLNHTGKPTMSSREIAELTGKAHHQVLRDIRSMMARLYMEDGQTVPLSNAAALFGKNKSTIQRHASSGKLDSHYDDFGRRHVAMAGLVKLYGVPATATPELFCFDIQGLTSEWDSSMGRVSAYHLDRYHAEVLVTGYDVKRRAAVIKRWHSLETGEAQPAAAKQASRAELILQQAQALVEHERRLEELEREQEEQRQKMRETECQLRAIAEGEEYFTVSAYCNLQGRPVPSEEAASMGRAASRICEQRGWTTGKAPHPRFGSVKTYPRQALEIVIPGKEVAK